MMIACGVPSSTFPFCLRSAAAAPPSSPYAVTNEPGASKSRQPTPGTAPPAIRILPHDVTPWSCTSGSSARNASFTAATSLSTVHDTSANVAPETPAASTASLTAIRGSELALKPKPAVAMLTADRCEGARGLRAPNCNADEEDRRDATIISAEVRRPSFAEV
jgi:hypothetical protein